jgi:hypothetical protein
MSGWVRRDAMHRWSRDPIEAASIRAQGHVYGRLDHIRDHVPDDSGLDAVEPFMAPLVTVSAFDLGQDRLGSFAAYRFLYERLVGAGVRPWLPGAFCAAAALPHLHPDRRACCCSRSAKAPPPRRLVEPRAELLPGMGGEGGRGDGALGFRVEVGLRPG